MPKDPDNRVINKIADTSLIAIAGFSVPLNVIIYFALEHSEYIIPRYLPPLFAVFVIFLALYRNSLSYRWKFRLFTGLLFLTGCFNLLLGLLDTASLWFILAIIYTLLFSHKKEALHMFFASFIVILVTGILMMTNLTFIPLVYGFDNCQFACVAVRIFHFLLIGYLVYYILNVFFSTIKANLKELEEKATDLQKVNLALKKEMEAKRQMQQEMLETVIQTEEKERKRIASDLHDGLGPVLSAINFFFQAYLDAEEEEKQSIRPRMQNAIDNAITDVSRISHNISPFILESQGLIPALENFTSHISVNKNIRFNLHFDPVDHFDLKKELTLYRTLTELINNTLKHSGATEVSIKISTSPELLHVTYKDNGKGLIPGEMDNSKGMGLASMANRIQSLKGSIIIENQERKGMQAIITIPYQTLANE